MQQQLPDKLQMPDQTTNCMASRCTPCPCTLNRPATLRRHVLAKGEKSGENLAVLSTISTPCLWREPLCLVSILTAHFGPQSGVCGNRRLRSSNKSPIGDGRHVSDEAAGLLQGTRRQQQQRRGQPTLWAYHFTFGTMSPLSLVAEHPTLETGQVCCVVLSHHGTLRLTAREVHHYISQRAKL